MDIQTKICPKCKIEKSVECYYKNKNKKDGLRYECKDCVCRGMKQNRQNNPEKIGETNKRYYQKNLEKVREIQKKYRQENLEKVREYGKQYYQENKEKAREIQKKYRQENPEKIKEYFKQYQQERRKTDPKFKLDHNMSKAIWQSLKSKGLSKKETGWERAVGYTVEHLKEYLEKQFTPEMIWENYGTYWHIDHIKPKSLFEYDSVDHPEFKKCWSLDNLRPLEAKENMRKSNKYIELNEDNNGVPINSESL